MRDVVPGFTSLLTEHRPTLTWRTSYAWPTRASPPAPSPSPPAVADPRDLWRLAQARAGDEVWLTGARVADARSEPLDFGP